MSKLFLAALAIATIASCATPGEKKAAGTPVATPPTTTAPTPDAPGAAKPAPVTEKPAAAVVLTDEARAAALWKKMAGYKNWPAPTGLDGMQKSDSIHGDYVRYFINGSASGNQASLPGGSILVKEGYRDESGLLKAITAMERVPGYKSEQGDWFFVRYNDSGNATRINRGCASCHEDAAGGDYSFIND